MSGTKESGASASRPILSAAEPQLFVADTEIERLRNERSGSWSDRRVTLTQGALSFFRNAIAPKTTIA